MSRLFPLLFVLAGCVFDASGLPSQTPEPDAAEAAPPDAPVESRPDARPDAGVPDAQARPDAEIDDDPPELGNTGERCEDDAECKSHECESFGALGKRCAALCPQEDDVCPLGTTCKDGVCGPN